MRKFLSRDKADRCFQKEDNFRVPNGSVYCLLDRCRELHNAALEERREAYRMASKSISGYYDQQNDLPEIKEKCAYQFLYL